MTTIILFQSYPHNACQLRCPDIGFGMNVMAVGHYNGTQYFDTLVLAIRTKTVSRRAAGFPRHSQNYHGEKRC
jgi:hypothetical protein